MKKSREELLKELEATKKLKVEFEGELRQRKVALKKEDENVMHWYNMIENPFADPYSLPVYREALNKASSLYSELKKEIQLIETAIIDCDKKAVSIEIDISALATEEKNIVQANNAINAIDKKQIIAASISTGATADSLIERAYIFMEDGLWLKAEVYLEAALDREPKNAKAYIAQLCHEFKITSEEELANRQTPFDNNDLFKKALRFADEEYRQIITGYNEAIKERIHEEEEKSNKIYNFFQVIKGYNKTIKERIRKEEEAEKLNKMYTYLVDSMNNDVVTEDELFKIIEMFNNLKGYKDSEELAQRCKELYAAAVETRIEKEKQERIQAHEDSYNALVKYTETAATEEEFNQIIENLSEFKGYKNADELIEKYKILKEQAKQKQEEEEKKAREIAYNALVDEMHKYSSDISRLVQIADKFKDLGHEDSAEKAEECKRLINQIEKRLILEGVSNQKAQALYKNCFIFRIGYDESFAVGLKTDGTVVYAGSNSRTAKQVHTWKGITAIAEFHTYFKSGTNSYGDEINTFCSSIVGLKADGTVVATKHVNIPPVPKWQNIIAIDWGDYDSLSGLHADGTIVSMGKNSIGERGATFLRPDGTVATTGKLARIVSSWRDIVNISTDAYAIAGVKSDGTVVVAGHGIGRDHNNERYDLKYDTSHWRNIIAVYLNCGQIFGLMSNGKVVANGCNKDGICNVSNWTEIVDIVAMANSVVIGIRADGTLVAKGKLSYTIPTWNNIAAIKFKANYHLDRNPDMDFLGLKKDGTLISTIKKLQDFDISGFRDIGPPPVDKLKREAEWINQRLCRHCGHKFKGIMSKICSNPGCGEPKDY